MPQPIETAPKDGTPILTDCGIVKYVIWAYYSKGFWACCTPCGYIFDCADNGEWKENPKLWEPLPAWITETP